MSNKVNQKSNWQKILFADNGNLSKKHLRELREIEKFFSLETDDEYIAIDTNNLTFV